jgi:sugar phosphate permease
VAGYLADRYSPKTAVLSGVVLMGTMLLLVPLINSLYQLYLLFAVMSIGITLGTGPILTKVVAGWFYQKRGLVLGLVSGAGSFGAMILVPGASLFVVLLDWKQAYWFLGLLLLVLVLPVGLLLIRNRPQEVGLQPLGDSGGSKGKAGAGPGHSWSLFGRDATFREAVRSPLFKRLTFGYFV